MMRLSLFIELPAETRARLQTALGPSVEIVEGRLEQCQIAFGNPEPEEIMEAENLQWVQLESVGFGEYLDLDWSTLGTRLTMTNLAGFFADPVAETGLAGILAHLRGITHLSRLQGAREWVGDPLRSELGLLKGAQVVMLGYGAINQRLAALLAPFGCQITTVRTTTPIAETEAALAGAQIVIACLPDTPRTRGFLNTARLALLPPQALVVNLGRGSLIEEAALSAALDAGRLGGAVLDVTEDEPLSPDDPLWHTPNIILTQHTGGGTHDEIDRKVDFFVDNFQRFQTNAPLRSCVDMKRGY